MTGRQKLFCELYAANPDATAAAVSAGYSTKSARFIGAENLTKPNISSYIQQLQKPEFEARVASIHEIQEFWTQVMMDEEVPIRDRLKSAELLGKSLGAFLLIRNRVEVLQIEDDGDSVVFYLPDNKRPLIADEDKATE